MRSHCFSFVFVIGGSPWYMALKELDFEIYQLQILLSFVSFRKYLKTSADLWPRHTACHCFSTPFLICFSCKLPYVSQSPWKGLSSVCFLQPAHSQLLNFLLLSLFSVFPSAALSRLGSSHHQSRTTGELLMTPGAHAAALVSGERWTSEPSSEPERTACGTVGGHDQARALR